MDSLNLIYTICLKTSRCLFFLIVVQRLIKYSSWQNSLSSVKLDGKCWILKTCKIFSVGLIFGLWMDYSYTFMFPALRHYSVVLAIMHMVVVQLDKEAPYSQVACRLEQVFFLNCPVFVSMSSSSLISITAWCWRGACAEHCTSLWKRCTQGDEQYSFSDKCCVLCQA